MPFASAPVIAGGITALAGLFGQGMKARQDRINIQSQQRHNKEIAKYNFDRQLEMWNKQNKYNAPASQMQRYQDAGLNPHLIYGSPQKAGLATEMPKYQEQATNLMNQSPAFTGQSLAGLGQNILEMRILREEGRKRSAEADSAQAQATKDNYEITKDVFWYSPEFDAETGRFLNKMKKEEGKIFEAKFYNAIGDQLMGLALKKADIDNVYKNIDFTDTRIATEKQRKRYDQWKADLAQNLGLTPQDRPEYRVLFNTLYKNNIDPTTGYGLAFGMALYETFQSVAKVFAGRVGGGVKGTSIKSGTPKSPSGQRTIKTPRAETFNPFSAQSESNWSQFKNIKK